MREFITVSFLKSESTYKTIFSNERKVPFASILLLALGVLYTFTVVIGYRNGFGAAVTPFLAIPPEKYYFYEAFFGIPVFFIIAIVFAGLTRLLSLALGGTGSFENNYVIYCTASIIPTLILMWLPETVLIVFFPHMRAQPLGGFAVLPAWADALRQVIGVAWPMAISVIGLKVSERVSIAKSFIAAFTAFLVCAALMVVFIR